MKSGYSFIAAAVSGFALVITPSVSQAIVPKPGDAYVSFSGPNSNSSIVIHIDGITGDRTVVSQIANGVCEMSGFPFSCCTGIGTGSGVGECAEVGTGPHLTVVQSLSLDSQGRILMGGNNGVTGPALYRVDPATGDREVLSGEDATQGCILISP